MKLVATAGNWLVKTPLFSPVRSVYKGIFKRDSNAPKMRDFYGQFFSKGDLVFDVGANFGEYAEVFVAIGARVIAVEPNPAFAGRLNKLSRNIKVESCAVGAVNGTSTLNVCSQAAFSTLSGEWMEQSKESQDYQNVKWTDRITVPVLTLDALAERHGFPRFVKIDVEGFETEVLKGMSFNPPFLSFEFNVHNMKNGLSCVGSLAQRNYEFRAILGRNFKFAREQWIRAEEMSTWLNSYSYECEYGDIFARKTVDLR